jgi:hypothetical protein
MHTVIIRMYQCDGAIAPFPTFHKIDGCNQIKICTRRFLRRLSWHSLANRDQSAELGRRRDRSLNNGEVVQIARKASNFNDGITVGLKPCRAIIQCQKGLAARAKRGSPIGSKFAVGQYGTDIRLG